MMRWRTWAVVHHTACSSGPRPNRRVPSMAKATGANTWRAYSAVSSSGKDTATARAGGPPQGTGPRGCRANVPQEPLQPDGGLLRPMLGRLEQMSVEAVTGRLPGSRAAALRGSR